MRLGHLNLRVADPSACRDFYLELFGFEAAFEAEGGYFLRGSDGFLLALLPAEEHVALPDGFHIGFVCASADDVIDQHHRLEAGHRPVGDIEDHRPDEDYVTFRCWDPDGTEAEVYWDAHVPESVP